MMIRTIYRVRDDDTGQEWDSPYGDEVPGYTILYSSVEFTDKVENLGHTYDVLCPEDPPV